MVPEDFKDLIGIWESRIDGASMDERCGTRQCLGELNDALESIVWDDAFERRCSLALALPDRSDFWQHILGLDPPITRIIVATMSAGAISDVLSEVVNLDIDSAEEAAALAWTITTGTEYDRQRIAEAAAERWLCIVDLARDLDQDSPTDPGEARKAWNDRCERIDWALTPGSQ